MFGLLHRCIQLAHDHGYHTLAKMLGWRLRYHAGLSTWEPWLDDVIPKGGRTAIDVGANVGQWTRLLAQRYKRVIAIEPQLDLAVHLRKTMPPNVDVVVGGLWSETGLSLLQEFHTRELATLAPAHPMSGRPMHRTLVPIVPLDSMQLGIVDLIKVDVEGGELEVLRGACKTLARDHPYMIVETHSREMRLGCETLLHDLGYETSPYRCKFYRRSDPAYDAHVWLIAKHKEQRAPSAKVP